MNGKKLSIGLYTSRHQYSSHSPTALERIPRRDDGDKMHPTRRLALAITASETGHLVLGTLHTSNSARTLDRVLDVFPNDQRDQIRIMVSESLRGIISQQLVPRADGTGRCLAMEILMNKLRERGSPAAHLGVSAINFPAQAFYKKLGFHELTRTGAGDQAVIYMGKKL